MAVSKTLAEMSRAVLYEAAIKTGAGSTFRHTSDDLVAEINSAYVEGQEESVARGFSFYTVEGELASLPTSRVASDNYSLIDVPAGVHDIARVDVLVGGQWDSLESVEWENLRGVIPSRASAQSQRPTHYAYRQFASVSGATVSAGKIAIAPFCSLGQYKLSWLPAHTSITDDTHVFLFPSETQFRWVVWNVVARVTVRDNNRNKRYALSVSERALCESRIGRATPKPAGTTIRRARRRWD